MDVSRYVCYTQYMTAKKFFVGRAIVTIVILLIIVIGFFAFNSYIYNEKQGGAPSFEPYRGTLSGATVCLPHKDTTGPQTKECAFGFKTEAGEYYVLDFNLMSRIPPEKFQTGVSLTASGIVTPIEMLSTDQWQKYNVQGIFSVTDFVVIDDGKVATSTPLIVTPAPPAPPAPGKCFIGGCSSQLCTDQPGAISNCMYRKEYACYKKAKCERQITGECGWTETAELRTCLNQTPN
jgi:hypothetical protein